MKICIIMSTYNGAKYIEEQLDSITKQEVDGEIIIYIRDDGSTDNTLDILSRYKAEHEAVTMIIDKASNVGASKSFLTALRECPEADIYAFSDQDDVWEQGKLATATNALKDEQDSALWISDYSVVDSELSVIKLNGMGEPCLDQFKVLFYNNVPGCVMVFNRSLLNQMRKIGLDQVRMHDLMTLNTALITGKIIQDGTPYTKYRQHGANVLGYTHKKFKPCKWIKDKFILIRDKEPYDMSEYAREVLSIWGNTMDEATRAEYALIGSYRKSLASKLRILSRPYTKEPFGRTRLSIRCRILLGLM